MRDPNLVKGWLSDAEGKALAALAKDKVVLEIGTYFGRSTVYMAQHAKIVHAVDWHVGDKGIGTSVTIPELIATLAEYEVNDRVMIHIGRISDMPLPSHYFDMAFIDGDHDLPGVISDCELSARVVKPGGVIAMHDIDYLAVKEGAETALLPLNYKLIDIVDKLGIFQVAA